VSKLKKLSLGLIAVLVLVVAVSGCGFDDGISASEVYNESYPVIINYDTSKHEDTPIIPIKGKVLLLDLEYLLESPDSSDNITAVDPQKIDPSLFSSSESLFYTSTSTSLQDKYPNTFLDPNKFPRNTTITFFVPVKVQKVYMGNWGENIKGYRLITDVVVLYWPEKEIAGWHRVQGLPPQNLELFISIPPTEIYGDNQVDEWILSLPIP
jgi:hypothetical protein